jgi:hypothetical protein
MALGLLEVLRRYAAFRGPSSRDATLVCRSRSLPVLGLNNQEVTVRAHRHGNVLRDRAPNNRYWAWLPLGRQAAGRRVTTVIAPHGQLFSAPVAAPNVRD